MNYLQILPKEYCFFKPELSNTELSDSEFLDLNDLEITDHLLKDALARIEAMDEKSASEFAQQSNQSEKPAGEIKEPVTFSGLKEDGQELTIPEDGIVTFNVGGGYVISLFDGIETIGMMHIDSSTMNCAVADVLDEFKKNIIDDISYSITLSGGWAWDKESREHGAVIKQILDDKELKFETDGYQQCGNFYEADSYYSISISRSGLLEFQHHLEKKPPNYTKIFTDSDQYHIEQRRQSVKYLKEVHEKACKDEKAGSPLINILMYHHNREKQLEKLFHYAESGEVKNLILFLRSSIIPVYLKDSNEKTALHYAVEKNNLLCAAALIMHGDNSFAEIKDRSREDLRNLRYLDNLVKHSQSTESGLRPFALFARREQYQHPQTTDQIERTIEKISGEFKQISL